MVRFLHTSDLHIGKRFGNMPEEVRGRLREARHSVIERLAARADEHEATTILVAGDTFDTETPTPAVLRQALAAMGRHRGLRWVILPGNHDSLLADELWRSAGEAAPENVVLALDAAPIMIAPDVAVLPAPCTTRRPGRDLSEWMDEAALPDDVLRIGLAHGPIQDFCEDGGTSDIVAPDRAHRAGLDYLALGDWHGQIAVNERTWYSGAPEPDRFKHSAPGRALVVEIDGPGAAPRVEPVETGLFDWQVIDLPLIGNADAVAALHAALPDASARRETLLRLVVTGRLPITDRSALTQAFEAVKPEFGHAEIDTGALATDCAVSDLDTLDQVGALRQAGEALLDESGNEDRSAEERAIAGDALARLFSYCEAMRR